MTQRLAVPSFAAVTAVPAVIDETITAGSLDYNGHVNVRGYFDLHMRAAELWFDTMGMNEAYRARTGLSLFSLDHRIAYADELTEGTRVTVHVSVSDLTATVVRGHSVLINHTKSTVSNVLYFVEGSAGLNSRRLEPFAEPVASALRRALID